MNVFKDWIKVAVNLTYIAAGAFVLMLFFFFFSGHFDLHETVDANYLSGYGSLFSGITGTMISLAATILVYKTYESQKDEAAMTRKLVKGQMDLSVKPDVVIADTVIYGALIYKDRPMGKPLQILSNVKPTEESYNNFMYSYTKSLESKILNIGFGSAKYINCEWSFDLEQCLKIYRSHTGHTEAYIEYFANFHRYASYHDSREVGTAGTMLPSITNVDIDYLIPVSQDNGVNTDSGHKIFLPYIYLFLMIRSSTFKIYQTYYDRLKVSDLINAYPECLLSLHYINALGDSISKKFKLHVELNMVNLAGGTVLSSFDFTVKLKEILKKQGSIF